MCGIYGEFNFGTGRPVDRAAVEAATRTLAHRGPDDEGYYVAGSVALGFRRLSIIDLASGHQPMSDPDGSVWVVFNGEIYNFAELRRELQERGHVFRTKSDTEVIVYGYKEWGDRFVDRLRGMFGLAVWDAPRRRLLVARDAMGIKPVYYRIVDRELSFASEMRALLGGRRPHPDVDATSLNLFLRHRFTPAPRTLFTDVRKLAPGTMLVVEDGVARVDRWYDFQPVPLSERVPLEEAARRLLELHRAAVSGHLISDVPVGLLLSGGIDSALLLAMMSEHGRDWRTFSVGYGTSFRDDELEDARRSALLFGARHTGVRIDQREFEACLPTVVRSLEEPVATSSIVPMYFVCQRASQEVKVALVGQGPDELFGGYTRHLGVRYGGYWRAVPAPVRLAAAAVLSALPRNAALKRGLFALGVPGRMERYRDVLSVLPGGTIDGLFRDGALAPGSGDMVFDCWRDLAGQIDGSDELAGFQWLELQSTLPDELLMYTDKMSMAHSLELRVPYLDRSVVEYGLRLDATLKIRGLTRKVVHRRVCDSFLPRQVIRRKKRGFASNVVDEWFSQSLGARMDHLLRDEHSLMYGLLRPAAVHQLLDDHKAARADNHKLLFSLVVLEEWMRGYAAAAPGPAS